ncbi:MAG: radical SAM protein [Candidatus Methylomirabilis sp.]|nr:radical SAM protein [Candidatus Methylomirabilis sp.]
MVWLATTACNARCLHCSSNASVRSPDELRTNEAIDLLSQLAEAGVVDLAISGGEPLLRPDLLEIIAEARRLGLAVGVGSNGAVLSERKAALLAASGINRFQVSLDGFHTAHDTIRRWPGLFDRALRTIEVAACAGLRVTVCCTINRLNAAELEPFTEFISSTKIIRLNFSRYVPTGRGTDELDLTDEEWRLVITLSAELRIRYRGKVDIVNHLAQQIFVDHELEGMPGFIGCQAGIGQGCVTANGTVLPCVLLPIPLGNIREGTFRQIWLNSPVIRVLQSREYLKGECAACQVRNRCGGCRAVAYAKTGDYLATDPRCWLVNHCQAQVA